MCNALEPQITMCFFKLMVLAMLFGRPVIYAVEGITNIIANTTLIATTQLKRIY
jgi:hypothetical protein